MKNKLEWTVWIPIIGLFSMIYYTKLRYRTIYLFIWFIMGTISVIMHSFVWSYNKLFMKKHNLLLNK